jgi:glucose-1-phosphate thymidylyltransferase
MKAVILAAGEGRRLRPLTATRPKVMLPVAGKPVLEHTVRALAAVGVKDLVLVVGYQRDRIQTHFGDGVDFGVRFTYVVQDKQLGTGHALAVARDHVADAPFLLLPGDNLVDERLLQDAVGKGPESRMVLAESESPGKYGVPAVQSGLVTRIEEKPERPETKHVSTGIYQLSPDVLEHVRPTRGALDLTTVLNESIEAGLKLRAVETKGLWADIVYPWDLLRVNSLMLTKTVTPDTGKATVEPGAVIKGPVALGPGTVVRSGAYLVGPLRVGGGTDIGPHCVLYPGSTIGDRVHLGPFCEIVDSVIMDDVRIGSNGLIHDAILDEGVRLNPRVAFDKGPCVVEIEGELHRVSGLGAVLGEDTYVGNNVVFEAGAIVGVHVRIAPNRVVRHVPDRGIVV